MLDNLHPITDLQKPKNSFIKKLLKFFLWIFIVLIVLVITAVSLVFIYEDEVKGVIITELNKRLNAEVKIDPKNIDLTIITTFPDCALEFKNIACMEAIKSEKRDTLIFAKLLQLKFDINDLWNKNYDIKKIALNNAFCRIRINSKGKPNYIVWKESKGQSNNDSLKFSLEKIEFKNVSVSYVDLKNKLRTSIDFVNVDFAGNFSDANYKLKSKGALQINNVTSHKTEYLKNKSINYNADVLVTNNNYQIKGCNVYLNEMAIETSGNMVYGDSLTALHLKFNGKNLDIQSVLSLLPDYYKNNIHDYSSDGSFYAAGTLNYERDLDVDIKFGINNTTVVYEPTKTKLTNLNLIGNCQFNKENSVLNLQNISANLLNDSISGFMLITNFSQPFINVNMNGTLNLSNLSKFWPIDTLENLKGAVAFKTRIKGKVEELKKNVLSQEAVFELEASLRDLVIQFKNQIDSTTISTCDVTALNRSLEVKNLGIKKGKSDLLIDGKMEGAFNYITDSKNPLKIYGSLKSKNIAVEDFLYAENSNSKQSEVNVPDNINFILDATIDAISFSKFNATKLSGNIELKNKKIFAENVSLETMDGNAAIDALVDMNGKTIDVALHSELTKINVTKLFTQLNNFNQRTLMDNNISGELTATIDFSGEWNKFLEPDLNSIKSVCDLQIEYGKLVDFKPLESLSKFVNINDLKNIKFSNLQSHIEIAKSVITIPKTAIKNSALNINVWGKHSFNNDIEYHIELLISDLLDKKRTRNADDEFGPIENDPENRRSAFVLMTGTVDKPIIKYDRRGMKQKIKEDIKQEKQNLKQMLKEEFGVFKKDTISRKENSKADQQFKLEGENPKKKEPKKKEEEDEEDF